jgi:hypothetical protein
VVVVLQGAKLLKSLSKNSTENDYWFWMEAPGSNWRKAV